MKNKEVLKNKLSNTDLLHIKEIIDVLRRSAFVVDSDLRLIDANEQFYSAFKTKKEVVEGESIFALAHRQFDTPALRERFEKILSKETTFENFELVHRNGIAGKAMLLNASQLTIGTKKEKVILLAFDDITERKQNESLQSLFDQASVAISILKGKDYVIEIANPHICELWGRTKKQVLGKPLFRALPEVRGQGFEDILNTVRATGKPFVGKELPAKLMRKGKMETVYFDFVYEPMHSSDGSVESIILTATDATERVETRQKIKENEERYQTLFNSMEEGFCTLEIIFKKNKKPVDYRFVEINPAFKKQTGLGDVRGKLMRELYPQHEQYWFDIFGKVALTGEAIRFENYTEHLQRSFEVYAFRLAGVKKHHVAAVFTDITARKHAEEKIQKLNENLECKVRERTLQFVGMVNELKESTALDRAILASIGEGLVVVDEHGRITFVNEVFEDLLGWKKEEVLNKKMSELIPQEDEEGNLVSFEKQVLSRVLAGKKMASSSSPLLSNFYKVRKNQTRFPAATVVSPIVLGKKIIGAVEVFRDITKERDVDKAKTEFVSLASHQLRTPTTAINWFAEMLLQEEVGTLNQKQKDYCQEIHRGNQRMIALMNELLTVSRIDLGTVSIESVPINLLDIVDDILEELQVQIFKKDLLIEKVHRDESAWITSDSTLVRIALHNLICNAVVYSDAGDIITVTIKKEDARVLVEVKDRGCGVPESDQSKIFAKFFRAENARVIRPDGTGLGLYMTKSIVEVLGGTIGFTSKEGKGATFMVSMPDCVVQQEGGVDYNELI